MKRQFSACQTPRSMHPSIFNSFPVIRTANAKKIAVFTYRSPHFCFPWRRPCFNSFRVIRSLSQCVSPKIAIFTTFWFPLGTPPGAITQNVVINEKTIQCLPNPSQHAPIYLQQFPSYSNRKCKKKFSRTAAHIFVSPEDAPATITHYVAWMERQFNACETPRSMYLSITACTVVQAVV